MFATSPTLNVFKNNQIHFFGSFTSLQDLVLTIIFRAVTVSVSDLSRTPSVQQVIAG